MKLTKWVTNSQELKEALKYRIVFTNQQLERNERPKDVKLHKFNPVFDTQFRITRCMGRDASMFAQQNKPPMILLQPYHLITKVIFRDTHTRREKAGHLGLKTMLTTLRSHGNSKIVS